MTSLMSATMKIKNLPLILMIPLFGLASCKKERSSPVLGKWQETKVRVYKDSANVILYDTTYVRPFTNFDYIRFDADGICTIGFDHNYYLNSPGSPKTPQQIPPTSVNFSYAPLGTEYVLNSTNTNTPPNPGGFARADTVSISANTLIVHFIFYSHAAGIESITDSYYTK